MSTSERNALRRERGMSESTKPETGTGVASNPSVKRYPSGPARIERCFSGRACYGEKRTPRDGWCGDNHPKEFCARKRVERQIQPRSLSCELDACGRPVLGAARFT